MHYYHLTRHQTNIQLDTVASLIQRQLKCRDGIFWR
jgi:hypothetical protein